MPRNISFTDETIHFGNSNQGAAAHFKTKEGATFTAHMKDGKVAKITATGPNGQPAKVFTLRETAAEEGDGGGSGSGGTGPVVCRICIEVPGGASWCYVVDCKNIPGPMKLQ